MLTSRPDRYLEEVKAAWVTDSDVDSDNGSPIPSFWDRAKNFAQKILQFGKTDMDLAALFDHTLLHEMTHSKAVGIPQSRIPEVESYGWDACLDAKSPTNSGMSNYPFRWYPRFALATAISSAI